MLLTKLQVEPKLYYDSVELMEKDEVVSISYLQRKLHIPYEKASNIIKVYTSIMQYTKN